MQDVQIARSERSTVRTITMAAGATATLVAADPTRLSFIVSTLDNGPVLLGPAGTVSATVGIPIGALSTDYRQINAHYFGESVMWGWQAVNASAGTVVLMVIESSLAARTADELPKPQTSTGFHK